MNTIIRLSTTVLLFGLVFSASAQDETILTLQTPDGPVDIPLEETSIFELLTSGGLEATTSGDFVCNDGPTCDDVRVSMQIGYGSFSVSPSSVAQGGNVTMAYDSTGAWECRGKNLADTTWDTFVGGDEGEELVSLDGLAPDQYKPCISCCNGPNCDELCDTFEITKEADTEPVPEDCAARVPSHMSRALSSCIVGEDKSNCTDWKGFWGREFPNPTVTRDMGLKYNRYLALEFNSGDYSALDMHRIASEAGKAASHPTLSTISRCPGDFDMKAIQSEMKGECYKKEGQQRWEGTEVNGSRCVLEPNKTYYLNILHTNSEAGTPPDDLNLSCQESFGTDVCGSLIWVQEG